MTEALKLVQKKLVNVIAELSKFADKYKNQPTLAFTHFQPAQPTTVGKGSNTLTSHRVSLISHSGRSNLGFLKWLLYFFQMLKKTDIV